MKTRIGCILVVIFALLAPRAFAFGPKGHKLVGTIADKRLAGKPQAAKISLLLKSLTLTQAATIADEIKGWDGQPSPTLHWTNDPDLFREIKAFLNANSNPPGGHGHNPDHHSFHYTDISISSDLKYSSQKHGAGRTDVVQMINYCIGVLQGTNPQPNQFQITPRVAVILLAHYLGDIHQPLHVGAAYFNSQGRIVDPDQNPSALPDHGGNDIEMHPAGLASNFPLHAFWDDNAVDAAIRQIKKGLPGGGSPGNTLGDQEIDSQLISIAPQGAPLDQGVALGDLSKTWANEILPVAEEAHKRLTITPLPAPVHAGHFSFHWEAKEIAGTSPYTDWAGDAVSKSIHRAGWRLAALLERLF